jgi:hypothetical protein
VVFQNVLKGEDIVNVPKDGWTAELLADQERIRKNMANEKRNRKGKSHADYIYEKNWNALMGIRKGKAS